MWSLELVKCFKKIFFFQKMPVLETDMFHGNMQVLKNFCWENFLRSRMEFLVKTTEREGDGSIS